MVSIRYYWPKKSLKRAQKGSKSSPNFNIELRTSRTLLSSPRLELNELEHPKKVELRTRTQVRSTTNRLQCSVLCREQVRTDNIQN